MKTGLACARLVLSHCDVGKSSFYPLGVMICHLQVCLGSNAAIHRTHLGYEDIDCVRFDRHIKADGQWLLGNLRFVRPDRHKNCRVSRRVYASKTHADSTPGRVRLESTQLNVADVSGA